MNHPSHPPTNKGKNLKAAGSGPGSAIGWMARLALLIFLGAAAATGTYFLTSQSELPGDSREVTEKEFQRLVGPWQRQGEAYVLEIRNLHPGGQMDVAYYNPRSINVARAEISREAGQIKLFVEMRDEGYPGSNYQLRYDPEADRLVGEYHLLPSGEIIPVEFKRSE